MNLIEQAAGISLITPSRLENLMAAVGDTCGLVSGVGLVPDMAELGVYRGGSALVLSGMFPHRTLHLFDTFCGLPYTESPRRNPTGHDLSEGRFACDLAEVKTLLAGRNVEFHVGIFPVSAIELDLFRFSFVHIDCDLYSSAKAGIQWFWPRMFSGGIMYFDDYGCDFTGVTDAVHESFKDEQIVKQYDSSNGFQIGAYVKKQ